MIWSGNVHDSGWRHQPLHTVPAGRHSIYFENPAVFNQLVRDFIIEIGYAKPSSRNETK